MALFTAGTACSTAAPSEDQYVRFEGRVAIGGHPADTRATVYMYYFSDSLPPGRAYSTVAAAPLDSSGFYQGQLGPYPTDHIDSLVARTYIDVCGSGGLAASVRLTAIQARPTPFTLPPLDLQWPAPPGRLGRDSVVCGATYAQGGVGEHPGIRLIFDSLTTLVYGRWDISHTASFADSYGRFTGYVLDSVLILPFDPYPGLTCTGLVVQIPLAPDSTFGTAMLGGQPTSACNVPVSRLSLFQATDGWPPGLPLAPPTR